MTYRIDSEFWHGYIRTQRRKVPWSEETKKKQEMALRQIFRNKTRMAAVFISNCKSRSGRDRYIRQLKRLMDVDVFGRCGSLKCEDRDKCDQMLARDYKFYLAFENSFCTDYVTEKLLRVMKSMRVVPVVRGGADYGKLFPRNSLIDTGSFFSAYELAHHLNALAQDEVSVKLFYLSRRRINVFRLLFEFFFPFYYYMRIEECYLPNQDCKSFREAKRILSP